MRWAFLSLILTVAGAALYLNQVGLPKRFQNILILELRARGIEANVDRILLTGFLSARAEGFRMNRPDPYKPMSVEVDQLDILLTQLTPPSDGFWISKLELDDGYLKVNFQNPERPEYRQSSIAELELNQVQIELSFLDQDRLRLDHFQADFLGAPIELTGWIANASSLRSWKRPPSRNRPLSIQALQWIKEIKELSFLSQSPLRGYFKLDAENPIKSMARLEWSCDGVRSRFGYLERGTMDLRIFPGAEPDPGGAESSIEVDFKLGLSGVDAGEYGTLGRFSWTLNGKVDESLAPRKSEPKAADNEKGFDGVVVDESMPVIDPKAERIKIVVERTLEILESIEWEGQIALQDLGTRWLEIGEARMELDWTSPVLSIRPLTGSLYEGQVTADLQLDTRTRQMTGSANVDFDGRKLAPLLTPQGRKWFSQFEWDTPPKVRGEVGLTLPELDGTKPDWKEEVRPTITIAGEFEAGFARFRGAPVLSGEGSFSLTNSVWRLPDLVAHRPEGDFTMNLISSMDEHAFEWTMRSEVYPNAMLPLLDQPEWDEAREALMDLDFNPGGAPPVIEGRVAGLWREPEKLELDLKVQAGRMRFRGLESARLSMNVSLANQIIQLSDLEWESPDFLQWAQVPKMTLSIPDKSIQFHQAQGTIYPKPLLAAIGPEPEQFIEPFLVFRPVQFDVEGLLKWKELEQTDLKFDLKIPTERANPWRTHVNSSERMYLNREFPDARRIRFHWWALNATEIGGRAHWDGSRVLLNDWEGLAYSGSFSGDGEFVRRQDLNDTEFSGKIDISQMELGQLMEDLIGKKKSFAGELNGRLQFEAGKTSDNQTWKGNGWTELKNGLIWDIPVFGFVSQLLNSISPGIGNSRATEARADFEFSDGAVQTENLKIQARGFALDYRGKAWYDGRIDARAQAALLNDVPVGGDLLSFALSPMTKLFEYHISGTLNQPVANPIYVPKWILAPLTPIQSVKGFMNWINPWDTPSRNKKPVTPLDTDSGITPVAPE